ncbi:MAG: fumarylacetoacetate hydrolase family protein [Proteobacteria bacterium]|nr:fumarylacetoacetate hydrolase family protein [Pseudomonadota bacterium]MCG2738705.1 fumarylacetoacetate hydrolase family protein [Syntrophaceae bacterium]MBU1743335.1 fumarylacetoacetate hydrolase family protein [Pseudomonadota bacterium]MBU1964622.1 fumarylacetoacetate hydrolase family protein [Pseudomonadota bacterium]MBU4372683.1 fumarylacetoacetate hydrolase family protein [Pseudomonadota bacterium]
MMIMAMHFFNIATIVSVLSEGFSIYPGDLIAAGTPEGAGFAMDPPGLLKAGDVVECEVENIGVLRNYVVAPK